ncbi:N-acetyltransferase [Candidatus Thorarchaeota archaeon]|nr:MAG: N-acetyltransferase [Candidatus Thorarchaeota archaeon]
MQPTTVTLDDGRTVRLRNRRRDDAEALYEMYSSMSKDTQRWTMSPITRERIERWLSQEEQVFAIVATSDDRIVGHSAFFMHDYPRLKGIADLGIQIHQDFQGVGLGTAMTEICIREAKESELHRLSLEVVAENEAAIHLYDKLGFVKEGLKRDAFFGQDGKYHDLVVMGQILD